MTGLRDQRGARRRLGGLLAAVVMVAAPASAQQATGLDAPSRFHVNVGDLVWVTTFDGSTAKGRVASVRPDGIELLGDNRRTVIAGKDMWRIQAEYRDSVLDGTLHGLEIGAAGGVAIGLISAAKCGPDSGKIFGNGCFFSKGMIVGSFTASGAVIGAVIGLTADALVHGKRIVYESKPTTTTFDVQPIVAPRATGVAFSIHW